MKIFAGALTALLILGTLGFGTVEAAEVSNSAGFDGIENSIETEDMKRRPWKELPPPPPPPMRPGFHENFGPYDRYAPPPPPRHHFDRPRGFEPAPPPPRYTRPPRR